MFSAVINRYRSQEGPEGILTTRPVSHLFQISNPRGPDRPFSKGKPGPRTEHQKTGPYIEYGPSGHQISSCFTFHVPPIAGWTRTPPRQRAMSCMSPLNFQTTYHSPRIASTPQVSPCQENLSQKVKHSSSEYTQLETNH